MVNWKWIREKKLELINLVGSVASIVGFAILILSIVSADSHRSPEVMAWQYIFFFMSISGIASTIIFTIFWVSEGISLQRRSSTNLLIASFKAFAGLLVVGVGFDALMSAIHWTWVLGVPLQLISDLAHNF